MSEVEPMALRILRILAAIEVHGSLPARQALQAEKAYWQFRRKLLDWILFDERGRTGPAE